MSSNQTSSSTFELRIATKKERFYNIFLAVVKKYCAFFKSVMNGYALNKKEKFYPHIKNQLLASKTYKPCLMYPIFMQNDYFIILNTDWIKELLKHPRLKEGAFFGEGRQLVVIAEGLGRFRMSNDRKDAKEKRSILAQLVSKPEQYIPKIRAISHELVNEWSKSTTNEHVINNDIKKFTVGLYLKVLFNYQGEVDQIPQILDQQIDLLAKRLKNRAINNFEQQFLTLRNQLVDLIGHDEGLLKTTDYLNRLTNYIDSHYKSIEDDAFASGLNGAVLAGYLAPYPAFLALILELGKNVTYQQELLVEWERMQESKVEFEVYIRKEDTLLDAIIHEVLRMNPSQPFLFRSVLKDMFINGYFVRKNTQILTDFYHAQRDPQFWGHSSDLFYPERFLKNTAVCREALLAYSTGPNNCSGQFFSRLSLKVLLLELVTQISWHVTSKNIKHVFHFALDFNSNITIAISKNTSLS